MMSKLTCSGCLKDKTLYLILVLALALRLYKITNPVADWHAFRQADTASVTREYVKHGVDLLRPRYHDLGNVQSGLDNPQGYRMVEFPIVNGAIAWVIRIFPQLPLVLTSRLVAMVTSLGTLVGMYLLAKEISNRQTGLLTALIFALLPYAVYYSRVILPEPFMLATSTWALLSYLYWLKNQDNRWYVFGIINLAIVFLLKPFVVFLAPVFLSLTWFYQPKKINQRFLLKLGVFGLATIVPLFWWRQWIKQFPEGIPASDWLFNGNQIRLKPAWWRWLFYERLIKLISGYVGALALLANLWQKNIKEWVIYGSWWLGMIIYLVVLATGNVQHDYYQVILTPIICLSLARGSLILYQKLKTKFNSFSAAILVGSLFGLMLFFSWQQIQGYFNINHWEYIEAGQAVDKLTPADAKVIARANGDTMFLFQTNRVGWPVGLEIEDKITKGATHYVSTSNDSVARALKERYAIVQETDKFLILDLTQPIMQETINKEAENATN